MIGYLKIKKKNELKKVLSRMEKKMINRKMIKIMHKNAETCKNML